MGIFINKYFLIELEIPLSQVAKSSSCNCLMADTQIINCDGIALRGDWLMTSFEKEICCKTGFTPFIT